MPQDRKGVTRSRLGVWWHDTFDNWFFRSMIGPAQTGNAIQGCDQAAREHWKRDLEARKRYTREQRELKRLARERAR